MDDDLTKRLRDADHVAFAQITDDLSVRCSEDYALAEQAADTIDALRERVKVLEGARGFDNADWYWRDLDPDDSGDTPCEAIRYLPDFCVSHVRSSFIGPDKFVVRVPTLTDDDDDEVHAFDTEEEAKAFAKARAALKDADT